MRWAKDRVGEKYGKLLIKSIFYKDGQRDAFCVCACDCGETCEARVSMLANGRKKSCGCLQPIVASKLFTTHGRHRSREYNIWRSMKSRCNTPSNTNYHNYGGRGITVCDEWSSFENFYRDMGDSNGLSIDRIDNNAGYSKDNCRWATTKEQAANKRPRQECRRVQHG